MYKRRRMRSVPDTEVRPAKVCTPEYALKKASAGVRLSRWELKAIADEPSMAFGYATHIVRGRWDIGEPSIMRSPRLAVEYASRHVGGRWAAAEPYIMSDPEQAFRYCVGVIRGRWEEAEAEISGNYHVGLNYARDILKGRFPLWEARMIEFLGGGSWNGCYASRSGVVLEYMKVVRDRVPALESFLMGRGSAACIYAYARGLGGRLPSDLHQKMMVLSFDDKRSAWCRRYVRHLDRCRVRVERWISDLPERDRRELFSRYAEA